MAPLPENLPWHALHTEHARFAIAAPCARRYPADVTPFAGTPDNSVESIRQLAGLLRPGEEVYLMGDAPAIVPELTYGQVIPCVQMDGPASGPDSGDEQNDAAVVPLTFLDAPAMVALTDLAFPGFFRSRTCEMGSYFGIRAGNRLVAMGGERLALPGWREISGICTHPAFTGRGYAARIIARLLREHADAELHSFLLVGGTNTRAMDLYYRLGFSLRRQVLLHPVSRPTV